MDAQKYFERRVIGMFAFLPAMGGATKAMLFQALEIMVQYYRDRHDEAGLHEEMLAFGIMLRRAKEILPDMTTIIRNAVLPESAEALEELVVETATAPDEETVRHLLHLPEN